MAKRDEYDELRKQKTKNRLSLGRKRKVDLTEDDTDERRSSHAGIENDIQTVSKLYILCDSTS